MGNSSARLERKETEKQALPSKTRVKETEPAVPKKIVMLPEYEMAAAKALKEANANYSEDNPYTWTVSTPSTTLSCGLAYWLFGPKSSWEN